MNPNNAAYRAGEKNRSNQLNPNNDAYWSSRGLNRPSEVGGSVGAVPSDADFDDSAEAALFDAEGRPLEPTLDPSTQPPAGGLSRAASGRGEGARAAVPAEGSRGPSDLLSALGSLVLYGLGGCVAAYLVLATFVRSRRVRPRL